MGDDDLDTLPSNPAARLLRLIQEAERRSRAQELRIATVWSQVLEAEEGGPLFLLRLGMVFALPQAIRDQVTAIPNENHDLQLRQIPKIEQALQRSLHEPWSNIRQQIDEALLHSLELISDRLDRRGVESVLHGGPLDDLRYDVQELYETVEDVPVDPDLRAFVLRQLKRILFAIDEFRLVGAPALEEAAEAAVGAMALREHLHGEPKGDIEKGILSQLGKVTATALTVVNLVTAPFNLAIAAQNAIGPAPKEPGTVTIVIGESEPSSDDDVVDAEIVDDSGTTTPEDTD